MPVFLMPAVIPAPAGDLLAAVGEVELHDGLSATELTEALCGGKYDVIITQAVDRVDAQMLENATVKGLCNYAVGFNNIDIDAATARGILVGNTPDALTDATANSGMLLLLAAARRLTEGDQLVRSGQFTGPTADLLVGRDITGTRLGVVGLGRIGKAMARRALGFGMEVVFVQRAPVDRAVSDDELGDLAGRVTQVSWQELLETSDHISLHVPLSDDTRHLIGAEELGRMKPTATLVNIARGPVVDEVALVQALREGTIFAAGLDVYENEPALAPGLADLPNVVLMPHIGSAEVGARAAMSRMCAENALAIVAGQVPPYPVNPQAHRG